MQSETPNVPIENPINAISQHLQNSQGMTTRDLVIFVGIGAVIGLLVLALTVLCRGFGWWSHHSPAVLFRELCNAHELESAERALLHKLVRGHKLDDPTLIFVLPERFDEEALPSNLRHRAEEITRLREQIFGSAA